MSDIAVPRVGRRPRNLALLAGGVMVETTLLVAMLSVFWLPDPPELLDMAARLAPPSLAHPFGTDAYGRDALSSVMGGSATALLVASVACAVGLGLGVPLGLFAAARRGWADEALMRGADLVFAFPAVVSAVLLAATLGPGVVDAMAAVGVYSAPVFARVARTAALRLWSQNFTLAARAAGKGRARISAEHIWPNVAATVAVQAALQLSLAVVAEAGLAYIGLSAQPPQPSWGRMLAEAQTYYPTAPWLAIFPGLAIVFTVSGFGLLGEGLRRRLEPGAP